MRRIVKAVSILFLALALSPSIFAQGHGMVRGFPPHHRDFFGNTPRGFENDLTKSVSQILTDSEDGQLVIVKGRLTRYLGDEKYELTDDFNESIIVELDDDKDWSYISKDQLIEVAAKVDRDLMSTKLEAKGARPLQPPPKARKEDSTTSKRLSN